METHQFTTCPVCGARGPWSNGAFRPFCSSRCKQIDLGRWFNGEYRYSEPLRPSDILEEIENLEDAVPDSAKDER